MKLIFSFLITASCLMLSQCRLVSDTTDYALYHDYYPALKCHQYKLAEAECRGSETKLRYIIAMMLTESEFNERGIKSAIERATGLTIDEAIKAWEVKEND